MNYFRVLVWPGGGVIGIILWLLSFVTLGVIVEQLVSIRRQKVIPRGLAGHIRDLLARKRYRDAIELVSSEGDFLSQVLHVALLESPHGYAAMQRAMEDACEERTTRLLRRIEWLNLIGNISPMLGLMGTVWGMIKAFFEIVRAGGIPQPSELAGAIGIALVTTLLGLTIAIPALSVYALLRSRIDAYTSEAIVSAQELIGMLRVPQTGNLYNHNGAQQRDGR